MPNNFPPPVNPLDWRGWVWPVPITNGRVPLITDGFSSHKTATNRQHLGVDIMFPKRAGDPLGKVKHTASPAFIAPQGTKVLAPGFGKIWDSGVDSYGHWVLIDHGNVGTAGGVTTRFAHLEKFARKWTKGDPVRPGDVLGDMGYAPAKDSEQLRHLHFELSFPRKDVAKERWKVDPAPYMRSWQKVTLSENLV